MINLDDRLKTLADIIPFSEVIVDVGTDHGKLPAYLLQNNKCNKAILSDISKESLDKARMLFRKLNLKAEFIVSDGLKKIEGYFDTVYIAGMGGYNIRDIISTSMEKIKKSNLVLSPNNNVEVLRRYLYDFGFYIVDERIVYVNKKFYNVIHSKSGKRKIDDIYIEIGDLKNNDPNLVIKYYDFKIRALEKSIKGIMSSNNFDVEEVKKLNYLKEIICKEKELYVS